MVIIFQNPQVREYLLEHGKVYTYRKGFEKRKRIGRDWATDRRCGKKIADVDIMVVSSRISRENIIRALSHFYEQSVLSTAENWIQAIKDLNRGEIPEYGWLYRVTLNHEELIAKWVELRLRDWESLSEEEKGECLTNLAIAWTLAVDMVIALKEGFCPRCKAPTAIGIDCAICSTIRSRRRALTEEEGI